MVDDSDPEVESDLRRRAAWLLVMLAIVAVLLIVVISALVSSGKGGGGDQGGPGPLDQAATQSSPPGVQHRKHHRRHHHHQGSASGTGSVSTAPVRRTSCPGTQTCILPGDVGNAIQAINDYRTGQGLPAVPGSVSVAAQTCAVHEGNGCSGGWAETELADPNGREAVQKILPLAQLDDPNMTSIEVGWAYDPSAQLYYFVTIRND